jgi:hypothetical protein
MEERYGNSRKPPAWRPFSKMALQRRKELREGSFLCNGGSVSSPPFLLGQAGGLLPADSGVPTLFPTPSP